MSQGSGAGAAVEAVVEGVHQLYESGEPCGAERWRIARAAAGYAAEGEQVWVAPYPYPNTQRFQVALSADWRVLGLEIAWQVGGRSLRAVHSAKSERWQGCIEQDGTTREQEGNYPYSAEVDYGSHLFNTFTLLRRGLGPGSDEEFPVLFIGPPFMAVTPDRQRYRFVERGHVETPAGRFEAWRWLLTHPAEPHGGGYTFWTDVQGVVIESYEGPAPGNPWTRLVEYRRADAT